LQFSVDCSWRLNPTLYEQRISRNFDRAFKQFKQEQAERKAQEEHQLAHAADLKAHHDEQQAMSPQPLPYNPAATSSFFRMTSSTPTPNAKPATATPIKPPNSVSKPPQPDPGSVTTRNR